MWTKKDDTYWIQKEKDVKNELVDIEPYGFMISRKKKKKNWKCRIRRDVLEALLKARSYLPKGLDLMIYDGWRPWELQRQVSRDFKRQLIKRCPGWSKEKIEERLFVMAPYTRIVPTFNSHRYGGAVDVTLAYQNGKEVNMGVPVDGATGEIASLLFFELKDTLTKKEKVFMNNRKMLITVMAKAGFNPYLPEFWHWGYAIKGRSLAPSGSRKTRQR